MKLFFKDSNRSICLRDPPLLPRRPQLSVCRSVAPPRAGTGSSQGSAGSGRAQVPMAQGCGNSHARALPASPGRPLGWSRDPAVLPAGPPGNAATPVLPSHLPAPLHQARLAALYSSSLEARPGRSPTGRQARGRCPRQPPGAAGVGDTWGDDLVAAPRGPHLRGSTKAGLASARAETSLHSAGPSDPVPTAGFIAAI